MIPTANNFPVTTALGRTGEAAMRTRVPPVRSSMSERIPRPLPMKRNTTAIDGAK